MWSGGSGRRPPLPPRRRAGAHYGVADIRKRGPHQRVSHAPRVSGRLTGSIWRKVRQRLRALWRWVVIRTVRSWFGNRGDRLEVPGQEGDVRQFPLR